MYRFALRPRWLLSHVFALGLVAVFVTLGFWQLDRHEQRADRNETFEARAGRAPAPVGDLLASTGADEIDDLRFRRSSAEGTFVPSADLLIDNRSHEGLPGAWVVTPLRLDDGSLVAVNRGFQGFDGGEIVPPAPPDGTVRIEGTLLPWDGRDCGVRTDDSGAVVGSACLHRAAMEDVAGEAVAPVVLQRMTSSPADADVLAPVPMPDLDSGPHRSYAVQWFIFATIGVVGYPLILRRVARDRATDAVPDPIGDDDDLDVPRVEAVGPGQ